MNYCNYIIVVLQPYLNIEWSGLASGQLGSYQTLLVVTTVAHNFNNPGFAATGALIGKLPAAYPMLSLASCAIDTSSLGLLYNPLVYQPIVLKPSRQFADALFALIKIRGWLETPFFED